MRLRPLAVAAVASAACTDAPADSAPRACSDVRLLVAASDYSSSVVCGAPGCSAGPGTTGADLGKDPQLAQTSGRTFFLARDNDLLFELDPSCGTPIGRASVHDAATSGTANPHDVAAAPDGSLFVVLYNTPKIAFVRDGRFEGAMDLSPYDGDGNPQADAIRIVAVNGAPKAFVTLERLDDRDRLALEADFADAPDRRGDANGRGDDRSRRGAIRSTRCRRTAGRSFSPSPGTSTPPTMRSPGSNASIRRRRRRGILVAERDLGASVAEVAVTPGAARRSSPEPQKDVNPTSLVTFDSDDRADRRLARRPPSSGPPPGTTCKGSPGAAVTLYVGDRRRGEAGYRVHVFEREGQVASSVLRRRTIDLPQPPVALRAASATRGGT